MILMIHPSSNFVKIREYAAVPLFHAIEAKLCVAMANEAIPAQVSVFFFEKAVA
jgi:hypothetical protein